MRQKKLSADMSSEEERDEETVHEETMDVYESEQRQEMLEGDEITAAEAALMRGRQKKTLKEKQDVSTKELVSESSESEEKPPAEE